MADDLNAIGSGTPDPYVQSLIDKYRQQQLAQQLAGGNSIGNPRNMGEGINAFGTGVVNMLHGFHTLGQNQQNLALGNALAGQVTPLPSLPGPITPPPIVQPGSASTGSFPTPSSTAMTTPGAMATKSTPSLIDPQYDPRGMGAGLQPHFADLAQDTLQDASDRGTPATIISGVRDADLQNKLYAQGRTAPGPIVTTAPAGQSRHNWGAAIDVRPEGGDYETVGDAAKNLGLTWGGDWRGLVDKPHIQLPGSLADARASFQAQSPVLVAGLGGATPVPVPGGDRIASVLAGIQAGESGGKWVVGDQDSSFGPYQMHMGGLASGGNSGPGLGDDFKKDTGLDPRNPETLPQQTAWISNWAAGKSDAEIKQSFHGYRPGAVPAAGPESFGVPPGQVAGPGAPSDMQEGRSVGMPPSQNKPSWYTPPGQPIGGLVSPSTVNPALSPIPMGPPQGFVLPGGDPGAVVGPLTAAPPVAPQVPAVPVGVPPVAVSAPVPVQAVAPATGGSAYDPRTGRFLAPGEQIPGYAPAPMSSTGGAVGGLNDLLASLFGGGTAQAAPASPTVLASSLGGRPPEQAGGTPLPSARSLAPRGSVAPVGASAPQGAGPGGPLGDAVSPVVPAVPGNTTPNPLLAPLADRYNAENVEYQRLQRQALSAANTPYGTVLQQQANAARTAAESTYKSWLEVQEKANPPAAHVMTAAEKQAAGLGDTEGVFTIKPDGTIDQVKGTGGDAKPTSVKEFEYGKAHPEFAKAPKWVPNARTGPLGEPIGDWVQPPNPAAGGAAPPVSPAVGNQSAADPTSGLTDEQKAAVGTPNSYTLPKTSAGTAPLPGLQLTKDQNAALANIPPERQGMVRAILANDMELPKVTARNKLGNLLNQDVRNVIPDFDAQAQAGRVAAKKEFLSGGNQSLGKQIEFGDTAISHLADVPELSDNVDKQLGNPSEGILSGVLGGAGAQTVGAHIGAYTTGGGGAMDAIHAKALTFSGELSKYLTGGEGTEAQREEQASFLSGAKTTYERKLNALGLLDTIAGRKDFIQSAWHNAAGPNVADFPVMSPIARKKMDEIRAWATSGDGAVDPITKAPKDQTEVPQGGPQGGEQGSAAPPAAPAAAPSTAYPGTGAQTYAKGTFVVPGSSVGNTPGNTPGMLKGEQDTRDPYYIAAGGVGPALALALGPSFARLGLHAGGKVLGGALTGAGLAGGGAGAWKFFK